VGIEVNVILNRIKQITKKNVRRAIVMFCIIDILLTISVGTYAWLTRDTQINNNIVISDFEIQGDVYFLNSSETDNTLLLSEILAETPYTNIAGETLFSVNLTDDTATNYIGNLRIVLRFSGASPAYIRVRLLGQWTENDVFISSVFPSYSIPDNDDIFGFSEDDKTIVPTYNNQDGTGWYDNRTEDFCYYYNAPVYPNSSGGSVYMLLVNGLSSTAVESLENLQSSVELNMLVSVEACQPNRYRELFNLDSLPWE